MQNDLLEEHKGDPSWAEIVSLYSGLFDAQSKREDFIINLSETDILLAAECKMSSVNKEDNLANKITQKSEQNYLENDNKENLINHCLILIEFQKFEKVHDLIINLNEGKFSKKIISSIILKCDSNRVFDFIDILIETKKYQLLKHSISLLDESKINLINHREKVLKIAELLPKIDRSVSSAYILEKITNYFLFPKSFVVDKIKEHLNTKIYRVTVLWIIKYKLDDLFSENLILSKIIESKYWNFVFDFIENSKTLDKKYYSKLAVTQIMENNGDIFEVIKLIRQYNLSSNFNPTKLIYYSIEKNKTIACIDIVDMYNITDIKVLKDAVQYSIHIGRINVYLELIEYYSLQSIFTINGLFENFNLDFYPRIFEKIKRIYKLEENQKFAIQLVENYFNSDKLSLTEKIICDLNLWAVYDLNNLIKKAFILKKWGLLVRWHSKYNLKEKYSLEEIINLAIQNNDILVAYQIAKEHGLTFSDFYKLTIGSIVKCEIRNFTVSRVFVKIPFEDRQASIHIRELTTTHVKNIYDFEYFGEKLNVRQKLIAKVISIDEKYGINLSLKNVDNKKLV